MRHEGALEEDKELASPLNLEGKDYKNIVIREVMGFDEEEVSKTHYKKNPAALLITLIWRCIAEVKGTDKMPEKQDIKNLPVGILDELTIAIRKLSIGNELEIRAFCPNKECKKPHESYMDLDEIERRPGKYGGQDATLPRGTTIKGKKCTKVKLRDIDGNVQERFIKMNEAEMDRFGVLNTEFLHACVVSIGGHEVSKKEISGLTRMDRRYLSLLLKDAPGPSTRLDIVCEHCGEEYEHAINILDFLA